MLVGRILFGMLGRCETGTFKEVENGHRRGLEFLAGPTGGRHVLTGLFRMTRQVGLAVTLHEREIQRPPADADDRHPDQFLFEKELEHGHLAIEIVLQHQDVDPALVIAGDQIPAVVVELGYAFDIPFGIAAELHPATIAAYPELGDANYRAGAVHLQSRHG